MINHKGHSNISVLRPSLQDTAVDTDLRSNVVRGPAERACLVLTNNIFFAHSKISYFDVAFFIKHHIVQF